ncbi:hypothetical protein ABNX05_11310 [Lysinibacillus sp. M3]|uniref:Uncharacterized protein n=1 Tax=Lysinibacillus zambalensis TaxID=3160866 RepID=A0ABV1MRQ9_9BACI
MVQKNRMWLQVPTEIVRNIGFIIDEKSFAVYAFLLYKKFKAFNNNQIDVLIRDIKAVTEITDNRTIKKCFLNLHNQGLIKDEIDKLPINKSLQITMLEPYKSDYFTQLPLELLKSLNSIGLIGFRLLYYYESYINRSNISKQFCFPSYETIQVDLGISNFSVTKYNKLLAKEKLLTITKHKAEYDPFGDSGLEKFNNHYSVNLHKL